MAEKSTSAVKTLSVPSHYNLLREIITLSDLKSLFKEHSKYFNKESISEITGLFKEWVKIKDKNHKKFFILYDDPDNFARNDSWGTYLLYRCIAVKTPTQTVILGDVIKKFGH